MDPLPPEFCDAISAGAEYFWSRYQTFINVMISPEEQITEYRSGMLRQIERGRSAQTRALEVVPAALRDDFEAWTEGLAAYWKDFLEVVDEQVAEGSVGMDWLVAVHKRLDERSADRPFDLKTGWTRFGEPCVETSPTPGEEDPATAGSAGSLAG